MKVKIVKKLAFASLLVLGAALFSSCQDVIFSNIRKEVELRSASVQSDIRSIIRYKNELYVANGNIFHKNPAVAFSGGWIKTFSPSGTVLMLAADSKYIYALVGVSKQDESEGENVPVRRELYYSSDGIFWNLVTGVYGFGIIPYNSFGLIETHLFCTNSIAEANRKAYFILKGGTAGFVAYELNGPFATIMPTSLIDADTKPVVNALAVSRSCVYCGGKVRFFTSTGSCTDETSAGNDATTYYYGNGSLLCWGGAKIGAIGARSAVYSIAYTSDYLLVGTTSGISHHLMSSKVPGPSSTTFITNAESTLSSQYTVLALLVTQPEKTEAEAVIYASQNFTGYGSNSAQFDHICLWSYYPTTREWNRE